MELKIIFVGICLFIGAEGAPKWVLLPDLAGGDQVHGHHIQAHEAAILIKRGSVDLSKSSWPFKIRPDDDGSDDVVSFSLDHQQLALVGAIESPFEVTKNYGCLVPRLAEQCPEHGALRPEEALRAAAAAWIELEFGKLDACRSSEGAVSSVYSRTTTGDVTIVGKSPAGERTIVVKGNAEIRIVNEPTADEVVPNHYLAYYNLLDPPGCCTNVPFPFKREGCDPKNGGVIPKSLATHGRVGATVACSNSSYP
jgi:hypothetical protein